MANMPPPMAKRPPAATAATPSSAPKRLSISRGRQDGAQRVLIYGPGGVGKTALAVLAPNPLILDLEGGSLRFDVARCDDLTSFDDVRAALAGSDVDAFDTVVIDTSTKLEELALAHVIDTVPHEKAGVRISSVESYGFGKGYRHLYDHMSYVLQDCDRLIRRGKNVILVTHSCTADAPNPSGDNWLRYEPRLQHPKKENSVRDRVFGWADHVLFVGYDVAVDREGKGTGGGTRTIYTQELPSHVAKTRGAADPSVEVPMAMAYQKGDGSIWSMIFGGGK